MWEAYIALANIASIYGLLKIVQIIRSDADDNVHSSLLNGIKLYFIIIAFLMIMSNMVLLPSVLDLSIDSTDAAALGNITSLYGTIYRVLIYTFVPFVLFVFIAFVNMLFNYFVSNKKVGLVNAK